MTLKGAKGAEGVYSEPAAGREEEGVHTRKASKV